MNGIFKKIINSGNNDPHEWGLWETNKKFIFFILLAGISIGIITVMIKMTLIQNEHLYLTFLRNLPGEIFEAFFNLFLIFSIFYFYIPKIRPWNFWKKISFFLILTTLCISLETFIDSLFPVLNMDMDAVSFEDPNQFLFHFFGDVFLYFVILSLFAYIDSLLDKKRQYLIRLMEQKSKASHEETQRIKAELKALKSQINPHFFFNTLNSLSTLISLDPAKAESFIRDISDIYRVMLGMDKKEFWTIQEETELIRNYINIEKVRLGERLDFEIICDKKLGNFHIPCFLIQPLVENSIKHGISPSISGGKIILKIEMNQDLTILVEDSRTEKIHQSNETERERMGLENIKRRLFLTYGEKCSFDLEIGSLGAKATIKIKELSPDPS